MAGSGSKQKLANGLVAMSSAAVLAVYSAGYVRTKPAADRIARQALERTIARQAPIEEIALPAPIAKAAPVVEPKPAPLPKAIAHVEPKPLKAVTPKTVAPSPVAPKAADPAPSEAITPVPVVAAPTIVTPTAEVVSSITEPPASLPTTPVPTAPPQKVWKDGKYVGWGGSRHGDIQATVVIESGRIVSAQITDCETRYPCDVIERLPPQVIKRQGPNVDRVSGATESADAFYSAVYFALKQAQ